MSPRGILPVAEGTPLTPGVSQSAEALFGQWLEQRELHARRLDPSELSEDPAVVSALRRLIATYEALDQTLPSVGLVGKTLGPYRIETKLGGGGMGDVYLATDTRLERSIALKTLSAAWAEDPERLRRLKREAQALAAIDHPNSVTIHSVEEVDGIAFITMAYIDGQVLTELIPKDGLSVDRFLDLASQLVSALRAAHAEGIIHRDLKPSNIMVDRHDRLRVLDFGLAKVVQGAPNEATGFTASGLVLGTLPFMSPEQVEGRAATPQSDIFSLGIVLYNMATGRLPFRGETPAALASSILRDEPIAVAQQTDNYPAAIGDVIAKCLRKAPGSRFATSDEVWRTLATIRDARGEPSSRPRRRLVPFAAGFAVAAALAMAAVSFRGPVNPSTSRTVARGPMVAALPFKFSGDPSQNDFVRGIHADLIARLSKYPSVRVVSRTSMIAYTEAGKDLRQIADELGAGYVLEGDLQVLKTRLRITVQLVDAIRGHIVWSDVLDRTWVPNKALDTQTELAAAIADQAVARIDVPGAGAAVLPSTTNEAAIEAYRQGLSHRLAGERSLDAAIASFRRAIKLDESFVDAWGRLAAALSYKYLYAQMTEGELMLDLRDEAYAAVSKTRALDAESAAAKLAWSAYLAWVVLDFDLAAKIATQAAERAPNSADILVQQAQVFHKSGRVTDAHAVLERAKSLKPSSEWIALELFEQALRLGSCELADRYVDNAALLAPKSEDVLRAALQNEVYCEGDPVKTEKILAGVRIEKDETRHWRVRSIIMREDYAQALALARQYKSEMKYPLRFLVLAQEVFLLRRLDRATEADRALAEMGEALETVPVLAAPFSRIRYHSLKGDVEATNYWLRLGQNVVSVLDGDRLLAMKLLRRNAIGLVNIGELDAAVETLRTILSDGSNAFVSFIDRDPELAALRDHPGYVGLMKELGRLP